MSKESWTSFTLAIYYICVYIYIYIKKKTTEQNREMLPVMWENNYYVWDLIGVSYAVDVIRGIIIKSAGAHFGRTLKRLLLEKVFLLD